MNENACMDVHALTLTSRVGWLQMGGGGALDGSGLLDSAGTGTGAMSATHTGTLEHASSADVAAAYHSQWSVSKSSLSFPLEEPPGLGQVRRGGAGRGAQGAGGPMCTWPHAGWGRSSQQQQEQPAGTCWSICASPLAMAHGHGAHGR